MLKPGNGISQKTPLRAEYIRHEYPPISFCGRFEVYDAIAVFGLIDRPSISAPWADLAARWPAFMARLAAS